MCFPFFIGFFSLSLSLSLCLFLSISMHSLRYHQQDQIKSAMDEATNNRTNIVGNSEETAAKKGRFISKTIFYATNTRNSGESKC